MNYGSARPTENPEVVFNLWAYLGEDGYIMRLAGKAYVMKGSDTEKLTLLRMLSGSDFLSAQWDAHWDDVAVGIASDSTPENQGNKLPDDSILSNPEGRKSLFGPLIDKLAKSLPEQVCTVNGDYQELSLKIPREPLCVSTVIRENEDGTFAPLLSS